MKTLLLASTALVATAGFAAADVAISGYAEIGIIGGDAYTDSRTQYHTDIDVTFSMTGESDGGLAFGAAVDLDENGAFGNTTQGGETYFLSYGGLRLDMGDTDSAYDAAMQEVNLAGASIADDETAHAGFNGNSGMDGIHGGQNARVSYSASGLTVGVSAAVADCDEGTIVGGVACPNDNPALAIGAAYTADMGGTSITVGGGYITQEDFADMVGISVKAAMAGGFSVGVNFSEMDIEGAAENQTHMAIGVGYSMDALSLGLNYGVYNDVGGVDGVENSGFGFAATYDLGGGLAAHAGFGSSDRNGADSDSYSLGLSMSF